MLYTKTELSEIVCTRISHDLIGNIGALSGALELIKESNNTLDDDTLNILNTATTTLKARQKFFRIAYGLNTTHIEMTELLNICTDYLCTIGSRNAAIKLKTNGITPEIAKILCLCVMIGADICIRGGSIDVSVDKNNLKVDVTTDTKLAVNKISVYQQILENQKPKENISQYVQLLYLKELIGEDVATHLDYSENNMSLTIG